MLSGKCECRVRCTILLGNFGTCASIEWLAADPSGFDYNHPANFGSNWLGRLFCLKVSYCWLHGQRFELEGLWYGICICDLHLQISS